MPKPTSALKVRPLGGACVLASRKSQWIVSSRAAKNADELSFTSRDAEGRICWWDVAPPRTTYWHAHEMLGRAYAFEALDLINNPHAEGHGSEHDLGFILGAIGRWLPSVQGTAASGMADGFFAVVSEYVSTGTARR